MFMNLFADSMVRDNSELGWLREASCGGKLRGAGESSLGLLDLLGLSADAGSSVHRGEST